MILVLFLLNVVANMSLSSWFCFLEEREGERERGGDHEVGHKDRFHSSLYES